MECLGQALSNFKNDKFEFDFKSSKKSKNLNRII